MEGATAPENTAHARKKGLGSKHIVINQGPAGQGAGPTRHNSYCIASMGILGLTFSHLKLSSSCCPQEGSAGQLFLCLQGKGAAVIVKQVITLVGVDEDSGREVARVVTKAQSVVKSPERLGVSGPLLKRAAEALRAGLEGLWPA